MGEDVRTEEEADALRRGAEVERLFGNGKGIRHNFNCHPEAT